MAQQQIKMNIPLDQCKVLECPFCESAHFHPLIRFRKVSKLYPLPPGVSNILPEQVGIQCRNPKCDFVGEDKDLIEQQPVLRLVA